MPIPSNWSSLPTRISKLVRFFTYFSFDIALIDTFYFFLEFLINYGYFLRGVLLFLLRLAGSILSLLDDKKDRTLLNTLL